MDRGSRDRVSANQPVAPHFRLRRAAAVARDQRQPGYLQAVEAAAFGGDSDYLHLRPEEFRAIEARFPRPPVVRQQGKRQRFALGDAVERTLSAVGITPTLVQKITRTKDCGCKARQKWLNQWGYKQQQRIEQAVNKAAKWYGIT